MNDFNPGEHLINIKNRGGSSEYLPVQWRLVWFRNECPEGSIETEIIHLDLDKEAEEEVFVWNSEKRRNESTIKTARGIAIFRATVKDGKGGVATGTGSETAASFGDFIEKAETKAIGRALAGLGYGTQFAPELNEEHRIADAPVDLQHASGHSDERTSNGHTPAPTQNGPVRSASTNYRNSQNHQSSAPSIDDATIPITERQLNSIHKLCEALGKNEPENVSSFTSLNAKKLIQQLTTEYRQLHNKVVTS
jgi:hypothetical protein